MRVESPAASKSLRAMMPLAPFHTPASTKSPAIGFSSTFSTSSATFHIACTPPMLIACRGHVWPVTKSSSTRFTYSVYDNARMSTSARMCSPAAARRSKLRTVVGGIAYAAGKQRSRKRFMTQFV